MLLKHTYAEIKPSASRGERLKIMIGKKFFSHTTSTEYRNPARRRKGKKKPGTPMKKVAAGGNSSISYARPTK